MPISSELLFLSQYVLEAERTTMPFPNKSLRILPWSTPCWDGLAYCFFSRKFFGFMTDTG